jgi:hypothetical protein
VYGGDMKIAAVAAIYSVSVSIRLVSEGQFTQLSAEVVGEVVTERNVCVLHNGELERCFCDTILPVEGK